MPNQPEVLVPHGVVLKPQNDVEAEPTDVVLERTVRHDEDGAVSSGFLEDAAIAKNTEPYYVDSDSALAGPPWYVPIGTIQGRSMNAGTPEDLLEHSNVEADKDRLKALQDSDNDRAERERTVGQDAEKQAKPVDTTAKSSESDKSKTS